MKKVRIQGKLNLNKKPISTLNGKEMTQINGGGIFSIGARCSIRNSCKRVGCGPILA